MTTLLLPKWNGEILLVDSLDDVPAETAIGTRILIKA